MSGPVTRPHVFPKKRFQAATVSAIDQHAAFLQQLAEKQQAQGEILADLSLDRDRAREQLATLTESLHAVALHAESAYHVTTDYGMWRRFRWLVTGQ